MGQNSRRLRKSVANRSPGYYFKKPVYLASTELRNVGGLQDSFVNHAELAFRFLEDSASNSNLGANSFLKSLIAKYKINTGPIDLKKLRNDATQAYISQTYSIAEEFFSDLLQEYREFKGISEPIKTRDSKGKRYDALLILLENIDPKESKSAKKLPEFLLIDYYRLIRNSYIHRLDAPSSLLRAYKKINLSYFQKHYGSVPSEPSDIEFCDFTLFTRALKYYSMPLNDACDLRIDEIALACYANDADLSALMKFRQAAKRLKRFTDLVGQRYAFEPSEEKQLLNLFQAYLLKVPNRKARKKLQRKR
jgi:hypothetical protein